MSNPPTQPETIPPPKRRKLRSRLLPLFVVMALGVPGGFLAARIIHIPLVETLDTYRPSVITRLYSRDGRPFAEYAIQRRMMVSKKEMSPYLINALVATEDANFYVHGGIDPRAVARALYKDLVTGKKAEGASTLTMQLARQVFLTPEKSWRRKINEVFLAIEIEKYFTKDQIIEMYANQVYLGDVYGVEAAARHYFGKNAKDLTIPEAALIVGMVQRPAKLSPISHPKESLDRRNHVLGRMLAENYISPDEYRDAIRTPIVLGTYKDEAPDVGAYFAEEVRQYIEKNYGSDELYQSGLQVWTTLDLRLQEMAEGALRDGLHRFDKRRGFRKPVRNVIDEGIEPEAFEDPAWDDTPVANKPYGAVVTAVQKDHIEVKVGSQTLKLAKDAWGWTRKETLAKSVKRGDLVSVRLAIDVKKKTTSWMLDQVPQVEGAIIVLDVRSGEILALSGGYDFERSKFNRAVQSLRQTGSSFKPFVYAAALERGFTVADTVFDSPMSITLDTMTYAPRNYDGEYSGIITLQQALEKSINVPAVKTFMLVGANPVIDLARRCGISAPLPPYPSLALGAAGVSPLEMAAAYNSFANQGVYARPRYIRRITDATSKVLEEGTPELAEAVSVQTAYLMTHMLEGVVDRGTAYKAHVVPGGVAGKTGTTNGFTDAWFIGFTPEYTIAIWLGHDDPAKSLGGGATGGEIALPIWLDFINRIDEAKLRGTPKEFDVAPGVVQVPMDLKTGRRGEGPCAKVVMGAFLAGTEPSQDCNGGSVAVSQLPFYLQRPAFGAPGSEPPGVTPLAAAATSSTNRRRRLGKNAGDDFDDLVARQRLAQPGIGAGAREHLFERLLREVGDQDDRDLLLVRLRFEYLAQSVALDAGQVDVEENHIGCIRREDVVELDPTRGGEHGAPFTLEESAGELEHEWVVVENENREFVE
ncbi:MAG: PBP1A family penicillin-binding protein [Acidobacteria bacterium]|nr:PBP1A family penicillin-binding protein [Acidobacteriota bacterium]